MSENLTDALRDALQRLAMQRSYAEACADAWNKKQLAFDEANSVERDAARDSKLGVMDLEGEVRALALVVHETAGKDALCAGVSVVMTKDYAIDEAQGFAWATEKGLCLIPPSLDVKAVKKLATVQPLPFVTVTEKPSVRIASDLFAVLNEVGA